jgi:hypothetical protein
VLAAPLFQHRDAQAELFVMGGERGGEFWQPKNIKIDDREIDG